MLFKEKNQGNEEKNYFFWEDAPNDFAIFFTSTIFNWPGAKINGLNLYN